MISARSLSIGLIILLGFLQYEIWFAHNGVRQTVQLKSQITAENKSNQRYEKINQKLNGEIQALKGNQEQVEALARDKLGMIKPDERYYQFVN